MASVPKPVVNSSLRSDVLSEPLIAEESKLIADDNGEGCRPPQKILASSHYTYGQLVKDTPENRTSLYMSICKVNSDHIRNFNNRQQGENLRKMSITIFNHSTKCFDDLSLCILFH
ncbi:hypothetical protein Y032_0045g1220 [Ancylostoma ceylanicum]|uniref:Uncharacterized protein n=1 Tax=Ancylostoma ceylanicum TaxID=53326 RepID=A0A016UCI5_9BILA|nr:hypothetical protein Y032_0045g1220 [Ancylostoma ceylanicum]